MKKMLILAMAVLLVLSAAACSSSNNESNSGSEVNGGAATEKVKLKLWTIWPSGDFKPVLDELVDTWNSEHPETQVEVEATENEAYKTKVKTAAAANELPDIFYTWGAGFSKPFVDGDKVLALDEYLNDGTKDKLVANSLNNFTYDNKVYGLPYTMWLGTFFVNQELFDKNSIQVPTTYAELLEAAKAFRAKGIDPIAVGGKDLWPSMFYHNIVSVRQGGAQLNNDALQGKASFEDPAFIRSAELLQEMATAEAFMKGNLGLTRDESEAVFLTGQIPMYFNGSWFAKTLDAAPEVKAKVKVLKFPVIEGAAGNENEWIGGMLDTFMVSSGTKYPEQAVEFLKYMTENLSSGGYKTGAGLPTWNTATFDDSEIDPLLKDISDLYSSATGIVPVYDLFLEGQQAETHKNLVAELLAGKTTPQDFSAKMQALER
ncbi:extracellular solute-binding protein [Paenibacillus sp. YIM B09110]|uniref:extracellular solute-binding protein n=1 Tax=Paenibacillus sp. YIM B09110 TaxID=3126102 RepID=UPI00301C584C